MKTRLNRWVFVVLAAAVGALAAGCRTTETETKVRTERVIRSGPVVE